MSKSKKIGLSFSAGKIILIIIATILMFGSRYVPVAGLPESGVQILGILIGGMILWLSMGVGWTSLYVLFALSTVPILGAAKVCTTSFGNATTVLMLYCFMIAACLTKSGFARRIAIVLMTNKLSRKSPWYTVLMFFMACFILGLFLPSSGSILVTLPIMDAILGEVNLDKSKKPAVGAMMTLGAIIAGQLGNGSTPISHAMTIQGMGLYNQYTGNSIDFFTFCGVLLPVVVVCLLVYWLICKYLWRPDVSSLKNVDFDKVEGSIGQMTQREKWSAIIYGCVILLWMLPGLFKFISPNGLYPIFSKIHNTIPPLIGLILMNLITMEDGQPILKFKDALNNVNWGTIIFLGAIMSLGGAVSNADSGISAWLTGVLSPVFSGISPSLFLFLMVAVGIFITNFTSNAVAIAVMMAIAMPISMGVYGDSLNSMAVAILVINAVQHAWATPPGTPSAAVAADYGWLDLGRMFKWGMVVAFVNMPIVYFLGSTLAKLLCK